MCKGFDREALHDDSSIDCILTKTRLRSVTLPFQCLYGLVYNEANMQV